MPAFHHGSLDVAEAWVWSSLAELANESAKRIAASGDAWPGEEWWRAVKGKP
jgi:hypothetical protein